MLTTGRIATAKWRAAFSEVSQLLDLSSADFVARP